MIATGEILGKYELTSHYWRFWYAVLFATILSITARVAQTIRSYKRTLRRSAPLVYKGTVYLYTSHDEDDATGFHMINGV